MDEVIPQSLSPKMDKREAGYFYLFFSFPLLQFKVIVTRPGVSYGRVKTCVNRMVPVVPQRILERR